MTAQLPFPAKRTRNRLNLSALTRTHWRAVLRQTLTETATDRAGMAAAGCAFYATLALFPAMSMVISIYGLAFDPATITPQLAYLRSLLPPDTFTLIAGSLRGLVTHTRHAHTLTLAISACFTLWSASAGTRSLLGAVRLAYKVPYQPRFWAYQASAVGLTLANLIGVTACIAVLVLLPVLLTFLGVPHAAVRRLNGGFMLLMMGFVLGSVGVLYRSASGRQDLARRITLPGALLAVILWLAASTLLAGYAGNLMRFSVTYGPLGAVAGLMMWFYASVYAVLIGAELNAALQDQLPAAG